MSKVRKYETGASVLVRAVGEYKPNIKDVTCIGKFRQHEMVLRTFSSEHES